MRKFVPVVIAGALVLAGCGSVSSGSGRSAAQARLAAAAAAPAATVVALGDLAGPPRQAVQPGRRIAAIRRAAGLGTALAFMSPR
jgi:hypothetical protein